MAENSHSIHVPERMMEELEKEKRPGQSYYGVISELLQHWRKHKHEE
jgi:predicted CopG family antitoxin